MQILLKISEPSGYDLDDLDRDLSDVIGICTRTGKTSSEVHAWY